MQLFFHPHQHLLQEVNYLMVLCLIMFLIKLFNFSHFFGFFLLILLHVEYLINLVFIIIIIIIYLYYIYLYYFIILLLLFKGCVLEEDNKKYLNAYPWESCKPCGSDCKARLAFSVVIYIYI
jgi:cellulose synthase/poly-beta-1,6-N-acetylglucosamine synthase-like glycosyltransferase